MVGLTVLFCPFCNREPELCDRGVVACCGVRVEMPTPVGTQRRWNQIARLVIEAKRRKAVADV